MPSTAIDLWSTSTVAQALPAPSISAAPLGQYLVSLALVLGLILLLAWMVQRLGWVKKNEAPAVVIKDKLLVYNRFNAHQTFTVMDSGKTLRCMICRGKQVELMTEIPLEMVFARGKKGIWGEGEEKNEKNRSAGSFQELWRKLIGWKGKRP